LAKEGGEIGENGVDLEMAAGKTSMVTFLDSDYRRQAAEKIE
jgi:hypothetical protein